MGNHRTYTGEGKASVHEIAHGISQYINQLKAISSETMRCSRYHRRKSNNTPRQGHMNNQCNNLKRHRHETRRRKVSNCSNVIRGECFLSILLSLIKISSDELLNPVESINLPMSLQRAHIHSCPSHAYAPINRSWMETEQYTGLRRR